ncbi:uncharacterized protein LOC116295082 [Actinia tenebrosa]|uniref:Uncharacterized protein LOC116295082 n=1 Tax=Actinia tenebrosa TaxID=6105 RepID=A0A6P8I1A8_ACTTE|nr:uncharacterized protein LOC116295082 [Actinia tenebrosa]
MVQWWVKRIQQHHLESDQMKKDRQGLNLQENKEGLFECRGRIEGHYPIYVPPNNLLAEKLAEKLAMDAHTSVLHWGVGITMATVREKLWIPKLRYLAKRLIKCCYGCKVPSHAFSKSSITCGSLLFQVVGIDYAAPIV